MQTRPASHPVLAGVFVSPGMTRPFHPLDHPALWRVPVWLPESGAWHEYLPFAFFLLDVLRPSVLVELGTTEGASFGAFCQAVAEAGLAAQCTAVAAEQGTWWQELQPRYSQFARVLACAPDAALTQFGDGTIDLLHVADAESGLSAWLPKLSARSVVLLSGYAAWPDWAAWQARYPHFELPHGCGLGVLAVGPEVAPELAALLALPAAEAARVQEFFRHAAQAHDPHQPRWRTLRQRLAEAQQQTQSLQHQLAGKSKQMRFLQLQVAQAQVDLNSDAWRLVNQFWALRRAVIPPASRREKLMKLGVRLLRILKNLGLTGTFSKLSSWVRRRVGGPLSADVAENWVDARTLKLMQTCPPMALPELRLPEVETAAEQAPPLPRSTVSVVIPTRNAGAEFAVLLSALAGQRGCEHVEVIVVDSGSTDGTVEWARQYGAHVLEIPAEEFSHAHARNLGAQAATGAYLLFMVQDALPASPLWLRELVAAQQRHAVAAVSCVEAPREDADLLARVLNKAHYDFLAASDQDRLLRWPASAAYEDVRRNCQLCNIACLIEREVFARYGFRGNYAEDLDLGMRLARDGQQLALLSSVKVIHSHNRPAFYHLKRGYVDGAALAALFADYPKPRAIEFDQLTRASVASYHALVAVFAELETRLPWPQPMEALGNAVMAALTQAFEKPRVEMAEPPRDEYEEFLARLQAHAALGGGPLSESAFAEELWQMLVYLLEYLRGLYEMADAALCADVRAAMQKAHALQLGAFLASSQAAFAEGRVAALEQELRKGV